MTTGQRKDLIVLTADKHAQFTIRGLLSRHQGLGIRPLESDVYVHPYHDPGCLRESGTFLSVFRDTHRHVIVVFDRQGCGREQDSREVLEGHVESAIERAGWGRARVGGGVLGPKLGGWAGG